MRNSKKLEPQQVFTPRSAAVNPLMYVPRDALEKDLKRAVSGTQHIIIHGESGCGKTWLYKKTLAELGVPFLTVNMANAARKKSVDVACEDRFNSLKREITTEREVSAEGGLNVGLRVEVGEVTRVEKLKLDPFEALLELLHSKAKKKPAFLVIDNLESIIEDEKLVAEVANLVTLLDDEQYAAYNVRLLIVGVPGDIMRYFAKTQYYQTLSNRITELPEVERLGENEAAELIRRGCEDLLDLEFAMPELAQKMAWDADYIPQYVQEVGLYVAQACQSSLIDEDVFYEGYSDWVIGSMAGELAAIEQKMNARDTKAGRKNQVIYTIGEIPEVAFKPSDVEKKLRELFPITTADRALNVTQNLSLLAQEPNSLIRRTAKGDAYRFINPKTRACIRSFFKKTEDEKVVRLSYKRSSLA